MRYQQSARMSAQAELTAANPVPDSAVAGSWRDPEGRASYEAIMRTSIDEKAGRVRPGRPRRRFVIGTAVVAAASVAAGLVISGVPQRLLGSDGSGSQATATAPMLHYVLTGFRQPVAARQLPPARSVLLRLARAADHRAPISQPADKPISYVVTNEWYMGTAVSGGTSSSVVTPEVDQIWITPGNAWRDLTHYGHPLVVGVGSKKTLKAILEEGPPVRDDRGTGSSLDGPLVRTFSLNPAVLKHQLQNAPPDGGDGSNGYDLFGTITLLHHQIVPPRLDAAMWRVLAARSDVRYLGQVIDRAGRIGDAVAYTDATGQERAVLIISPTTGQLLGWEDIYLRNPGGLHLASYPAVAGYVSFLTEHWTKTMGSSRR